MEPIGELSEADEELLLALARQAIEAELGCGERPRIDLDALAANLTALRGTFVTVRKCGALRGCIGSLEARDPLIESVCRNARQAAFGDPRFAPLSRDELDEIELHISVLSPMEPLEVESEGELLAALRPGIDGLVIEDDGRRATFLPAVWESLPEPTRFLHELERKAGLPVGHWSAGFKAWRYTTHSFPHEHDSD